jgi:hypothetical protein
MYLPLPVVVLGGVLALVGLAFLAVTLVMWAEGWPDE